MSSSAFFLAGDFFRGDLVGLVLVGVPVVVVVLVVVVFGMRFLGDGVLTILGFAAAALLPVLDLLLDVRRDDELRVKPILVVHVVSRDLAGTKADSDPIPVRRCSSAVDTARRGRRNTAIVTIRSTRKRRRRWADDGDDGVGVGRRCMHSMIN